MWPSSAPAPIAPRYERAVEDQPAADAGADRQQRPRRVAPCAAPARHSASAATFASLSTTTGRPSRSAIRSRNGTSLSGRFTAIVAIAAALVDQAGDPEADGVDLARRRRARASSTAVDDRVEQLALRRARAPTRCDAVVDVEIRVDDAGEQLRAAEIDPDNALRRHLGHYRPAWQTTVTTSRGAASRPAYTRLPRRGRASLRERLHAARTRGLDAAARAGDGRATRAPAGAARRPRCPPRRPRRRGRARRAASRRGASCSGSRSRSAAGSLLSLVLFLVSAQIEHGKVSDEAKAALDDGRLPAHLAPTRS